jgi:hypothetical protein
VPWNHLLQEVAEAPTARAAVADAEAQLGACKEACVDDVGSCRACLVTQALQVITKE